MSRLDAKCDNCGKIFRIGTSGTISNRDRELDYCNESCQKTHMEECSRAAYRACYEYKTSGMACCVTCGESYDVKSGRMKWRGDRWECGCYLLVSLLGTY